MNKSYSELVSIPTFEDRLRYLMLHGDVARETFGYDRYLNQLLYKCPEWRSLRDRIIVRDAGCDLAFRGYEIPRRAIIHHINPISVQDIYYKRDIVFDEENLVTTVLKTHNIIHYGSEDDVRSLFMVERQAFDTCPWRN